MTQWWEGLDGLAKVLYCISIPATIILILQTIMLILGFGDSEVGADFSVDADGMPDGLPDGDFSADGAPAEDFAIGELFTAQGIMAFICVFSWAGIVANSMNAPNILAIIIGLVCGFLAMLGVAKVLKLSAKLAENGTVMLENAKGMTATVYVKIPQGRQNHGKVTINLQGRLVEADAVSADGEEIPTGTKVKIVDVSDDLLVCESEENRE